VKAARYARAVRLRLAPEGSRRERGGRFLYGPFVKLLPRRVHESFRHARPIPTQIIQLRDPPAVADPARTIARILVLKLDHFGDMILSVRALRTLRETFPHAKITIVAASWNEALVRDLGWFDEIVCFDFFTARNRDWQASPEFLQSRYELFEELELGRYDLALDLRHDEDTRPCLYRVRARYRAGFYAAAEPGLPHLDLMLPKAEGIPVAADMSRSLHAELRLQTLVGAVVAAVGDRRPHPLATLFANPKAPPRAYSVIAVGAGDPIRCWPLERFAEVGRELVQLYGLDIVVVGGRADAADADRLVAMLPRGRARAVIGTPVAELAGILATATLCICNGSGVSHLAAALGVRTVCVLSGASRMEVWRPSGPHAISIGGLTSCQPCGLREAQLCPWDVACLHAVQADDVLQACAQLLASERIAETEAAG
jgi:ADP-heptose:LPS heptosyltransferase